MPKLHSDIQRTIFCVALIFLFVPKANAQSYDFEPTTYLEQNWSGKVRQAFYDTPQGSQLIPLKFAVALQEPKTGESFFTSEHLRHYGFIPQKPDPKRNPLGLPIGLTIDGSTGVPSDEDSAPNNIGRRYIGMNCAACHTNNLRYNGKTVRIDGGQSLLNFQAFVNGMDEAIFTTAKDQARLREFLSRVQKASKQLKTEKQLRKEFQSFVDERSEWQKINSSTARYGYGRTDAFGVIFNQVLARSTKIHSNAREPDAPVSYPVLWDTPQHDFVQWNGIASNSEASEGTLARNIGQVLGVFGTVDVFRGTEILNGYCSSARRRNLVSLEDSTRALVSPRWPEEIFGALNPAKVRHGQALYQNRCVSCHAVQSDTRSPQRTITAQLFSAAKLGVDTKLGANSGRLLESGPLQGHRTRLLTGRALDAFEPATILLSQVVAGALAGSISPVTCSQQIDADPEMISKAWLGVLQKLQNPPPDDPLDQLPAPVRVAIVRQAVARVKARPLNGLWAAPPFLHNGSVKNIYELLLSAKERSTKFVVGCVNYDPIKLGYDCGSPEAITSQDDVSIVDTTVSGSYNTGHEFGQGLTDGDRLDLLEYLKTL